MYVPSIAVVSHYFKKRRALAMTIVWSGSSLGAVIHPIMLNNTLRSHLGFFNAVRASAGLVSGLLLIACLLMHPRLPPSKTQPPFWKSLRNFHNDSAYMFATVGSVQTPYIEFRSSSLISIPLERAYSRSDSTSRSSICN